MIMKRFRNIKNVVFYKLVSPFQRAMGGEEGGGVYRGGG